jgi:hypothetical protein
MHPGLNRRWWLHSLLAWLAAACGLGRARARAAPRAAAATPRRRRWPLGRPPARWTVSTYDGRGRLVRVYDGPVGPGPGAVVSSLYG